MSFAKLAWYAAGKKSTTAGDAKQIATAWGLTSPSSANDNPPRGALVFWNATDSKGKNWGHVMVSLGNGYVAGTQGWESQLLPTYATTVTTLNGRLGHPLGWKLP